MLECRLIQFEGFPVYRHVLVEAAVDHRGNAKPLYYTENRERFAPWADQIVHVVADDMPAAPGRAGAFEREAAQRDATSRGLADADPEDWLILADVDEIPNAAAMQRVQNQETGILEMTFCLFAADWVLGRIRTSVICQAGPVTSCSKTRRDGWGWYRFGGTGHHLSWLGGQAGIAAKIASHCHEEADASLAARNSGDELYRQGANPFTAFPELSGPLTPVDVDETWPAYVWNRVLGKEPCAPANWFRPREPA